MSTEENLHVLLLTFSTVQGLLELRKIASKVNVRLVGSFASHQSPKINFSEPDAYINPKLNISQTGNLPLSIRIYLNSKFCHKSISISKLLFQFRRRRIIFVTGSLSLLDCCISRPVYFLLISFVEILEGDANALQSLLILIKLR